MKLTTRDLTKAGLFTALHIAAAVILRFGGEAAVPFSLLPFFIVLAGTLLGPTGAWSLVLYALIGLIGVPVFAQPPYGGPSYFLLPSAGFIFGYILTAWFIGWRSSRLAKLSVGRLFLISVAGLGILYACGLPYLYFIFRTVIGRTLTLQQVLMYGFYPFIGFDLVKALVAAALTVAVRKRIASA